MWVLVGTTEVTKGSSVWLQPGRAYTVGRKDAHIVLGLDKSVSRTHACITVSESLSPQDLGRVDVRTTVIVKDGGSKFGTFVNGSPTKVDMQQGTEMKDGDTVAFGVNDSLFRLTHIPVTLCCSGMRSRPKAEVADLAHRYDMRMVKEWSLDATHLVVTNLRVTMKVVLALASGKTEVVSEEWVHAFASLDPLRFKMPDVKRFLPPLQPEPDGALKIEDVDFSPRPERAVLFRGVQFLVFSEPEMAVLQKVVETAGGAISLVPVPANTTDLDRFVGKIRAMDTSPCIVQTNAPVTPEWTSLVQALSGLHLRCIMQDDVAKAVLFVDKESYCNPRFQQNPPQLTISTQPDLFSNSAARPPSSGLKTPRAKYDPFDDDGGALPTPTKPLKSVQPNAAIPVSATESRPASAVIRGAKYDPFEDDGGMLPTSTAPPRSVQPKSAVQTSATKSKPASSATRSAKYDPFDDDGGMLPPPTAPPKSAVPSSATESRPTSGGGASSSKRGGFDDFLDFLVNDEPTSGPPPSGPATSQQEQQPSRKQPATTQSQGPAKRGSVVSLASQLGLARRSQSSVPESRIGLEESQELLSAPARQSKRKAVDMHDGDDDEDWDVPSQFSLRRSSKKPKDDSAPSSKAASQDPNESFVAGSPSISHATHERIVGRHDLSFVPETPPVAAPPPPPPPAHVQSPTSKMEVGAEPPTPTTKTHKAFLPVDLADRGTTKEAKWPQFTKGKAKVLDAILTLQPDDNDVMMEDGLTPPPFQPPSSSHSRSRPQPSTSSSTPATAPPPTSSEKSPQRPDADEDGEDGPTPRPQGSTIVEITSLVVKRTAARPAHRPRRTQGGAVVSDYKRFRKTVHGGGPRDRGGDQEPREGRVTTVVKVTAYDPMAQAERMQKRGSWLEGDNEGEREREREREIVPRRRQMLSA
ncbi:hypothetical protein HKX48_008987 [Thoreauomyces humboldtii]|nr:hypothetical protein HKX48_008987 [Thoreauomyces humboldtii]